MGDIQFVNLVSSPHSLGKLIEWKHVTTDAAAVSICCPHSLGKLIEWKQQGQLNMQESLQRSPLAGETN